MGTAARAFCVEQPGKRILVLGCELADLFRAVSPGSLAQLPEILHIPDWRETSRERVWQFNPDVVVCSSESFRGLCFPSARLKEEARGLKVRHREMLSLISKGLTNHEIANITGLSERVVRGGVSCLLVLLNASNRTELAGLAPPDFE